MNKKTKSSLNIGPKIGFAVNYDQLPNWNFFVFFYCKRSPQNQTMNGVKLIYKEINSILSLDKET